MTRDEAMCLKSGDKVIIDSEWNKIEIHRQFDRSGTPIISIRNPAQSQTGITVFVEDMHGEKWEIDASWVQSIPDEGPLI